MNYLQHIRESRECLSGEGQPDKTSAGPDPQAACASLVHNAMERVAKRYRSGAIERFTESQVQRTLGINERLEKAMLENDQHISAEVSRWELEWMDILREVNGLI